MSKDNEMALAPKIKVKAIIEESDATLEETEKFIESGSIKKLTGGRRDAKYESIRDDLNIARVQMLTLCRLELLSKSEYEYFDERASVLCRRLIDCFYGGNGNG